MIQPANPARITVCQNGEATERSAIVCSACIAEGARMPGRDAIAANSTVPMELDASTIAQTRMVRPSVGRLRRVSAGISAVSVVSVKSC